MRVGSLLNQPASSPTDRWHDRNDGSVLDCGRQPVVIANVIFSNKDIDVLAYFALFIQDAVAQARANLP
jgi:hypothetical protein